MGKEKVFTLKIKLNFKVKDINEQNEKRNVHLYKVAFFSAFMFSIVIIPIIIFSIMLFSDINLNFYFDNWKEIKTVLNLPSKVAMLTPLICSWVFCGLAFLGFIFLKPFMTSKQVNFKQQTVYWVNLLLVAVIALLLAAVAQYYFSIYQDFFNFEALILDYNQDLPNQVITKVSHFFSDNLDKSYKWVNEEGVWWILFIQTVILFMLSLGIQNAIVANVDEMNINKYIDYLNKKDTDIGHAKIKLFFNKIFSNSDKSIANWTIAVAFCILVPEFIFIILTSFNSTDAAKAAHFINIVPELMKRFELNSKQTDFSLLLGFSNRYFSYSSLPVISMGVTFSTILYFVSVSIRGENKSQATFVTQYFIILSELFIVIILNIYSKIEVHNLIKTWNLQVNSDQIMGQAYINDVAVQMGQQNFSKIQQLYNLEAINKKISLTWAEPINIIIESIILFSILTTSFIIIGRIIFFKSNFKKKINSQMLENKLRRGKNAK